MCIYIYIDIRLPLRSFPSVSVSTLSYPVFFESMCLDEYECLGKDELEVEVG